MQIRVRYLYTFHMRPEAVDTALHQKMSAVTDFSFDLQSERNGDSGADAFADLETVRDSDHPHLTAHLGRSAGLLAVSYEATVESGNLLREEKQRTSEVVQFVTSRYNKLEQPSLQWVHRLIMGSDEQETEIRNEILPLSYNQIALLSRHGSCLMGRGYSAVFSRHPDQFNAVELGLVSAMQVHLLVDQVSRGAAQLLSAAQSPELSGPEATTLAEQVSDLIIRVRHIAEFTRRLRVSLLDARGVTFEATIAAWRVGQELEDVGERVDACAAVVGTALDRQRAERESHRNLSLFALAMLGVGQVIFASYDFVTSDRTGVGKYPRPVILATAIGFVAVLIVLDLRRTHGRRVFRRFSR